MSGVEAINPLVDGSNRHGGETFNGDAGRAGHHDGVGADSPMSETSARGQCGAGIENDFPVTGLADEKGFRGRPATNVIAVRRWVSRPAGGQEV